MGITIINIYNIYMIILYSNNYYTIIILNIVLKLKENNMSVENKYNDHAEWITNIYDD